MLVNDNVYECKARGNIKQNAKLQVGDLVFVELIEKDYVITKLQPRKNSLMRPYISNIDQLIIVISTLPKPDLLLVDKLLIGCQINHIEPVIVVNKSDLMDNSFFHSIKEQYTTGVTHILLTSAETKEGVAELKELLQGKLTAFCGQSAVGKSSLINAIFGNLNLKVGELSQKINIGKNTTRQTQIFVLNNNAFVADTPGFNMLDYYELEPSDLKNYYAELVNYNNLCYFNNCNHINETNCKVISDVNDGVINQQRYLRYVELYNKLLEHWRKKYD